MNEDVKKHISDCLLKGIRLDGRKKNEFRDIEIQTGVSSTAEGSARVKCGDTEVIAGVKMAVGVPYPDSPDDGVLMVGAELLPLSNPEFESGPPRFASIEIARVIDRGIRESKTIDTKSLCIEPGKKVWMVQVDICPINSDGNLIDIGSIAALAALKTAKFPSYDEKLEKVDYHTKTDKKLPLSKNPIPLVDPLEAEEKALDARLTVTHIDDGKICSLQKGGEASLTVEDIDAMVALADENSKKLREQINKVEG